MRITLLLCGSLAVLMSACGNTPLSQEDGAAQNSGLATGADAAVSETCRGPGRYEAGKEGSYKPCCAGLTEVFYQKAGYVNGAPGCFSAPLRIYACVSGTCGDGICEAGESEPCGCVADCPSARWGGTDGGSATCGGSAGSTCSTGQFCDPPAGVCGTVKEAAGTCQPVPQACDDILQPVCGCDGKTYDNDCSRQRAGIAKQAEGACARKAAGAGETCGGLAGLPCGSGLLCEQPAGTCKVADGTGKCVPGPTPCTKEFKPVCGCDGMTYGNDCMRRNARVTKDHDGACP